MTNKQEKTISYKQIAYNYIKKEIVSCIIKPGGMIDEKRYIEELGISRTPVREAINSLAEEGLVNIMPRKGIVVTHISVSDIFKCYELRKLVEPYAIRTAQIDGEAKKELLKIRNFFETAEEVDLITMTEWDNKLHTFFAVHCGSKLLLDFQEKLMTQSARVSLLSSAHLINRLKGSRKEHILLIDKILMEDIEGAVDVITKHLDLSIEGYKNIFTDQTYFTL